MTVRYYGPNTASKELFTEQLIDSSPPVISINVETISLKERMPIGFGIAVSPVESWYFQTHPELDKEIELVLPLLNNPKTKKAFHNAIFDLRALPLIFPIDNTNIADTNIMARLLGRTETRLSWLAFEVGREAIADSEMLGPGQTMLDLPTEQVAASCANKTQVTLALYYQYLEEIDPEYFKVEMEVIPVLIDISLRGLKINQEDRAKEEARLEKEVSYYKNLCDEEDFSPASNQQVGYILAKRGNFLPFTRSKKNLRVDEETLEFIDDPLAAAVLNFRKANKLLTTYIKPLAKEDRMYSEYYLDTVVGRTNSRNRNAQNIPPADEHSPGTRYIFEPDSGVYTIGDFSQEHLRILMYLSGDREMERVYYEGEADGDIHKRTALELNITRRLAKTINFAIPYGATAYAVSVNAKIRDQRRCARFLDSWFDLYRDAAEWIRGAKDYGIKNGKALPTLFGREIPIPEEYDRWGKINIEAMERKAVNYPIIGSDAEIMKRALIMCKHLPLVATVHDSITADGNIDFPIEQLETIAPVRIPFVVKRAKRWE